MYPATIFHVIVKFGRLFNGLLPIVLVWSTWKNVRPYWRQIHGMRRIAKVCTLQILVIVLDEPQCDAGGIYCPADCTCKLTVVRCSDKVILYCSKNVSFQNLTSIPIGIPDDTTELFLDSNRINEIPLKAFSGLTKLTKLLVLGTFPYWALLRDMSHNLLESIENRIFAKMSRLSTLILSYNKIKVSYQHRTRQSHILVPTTLRIRWSVQSTNSFIAW